MGAMHAVCQYFVDMNRQGLPPSHERMRVPQTFPTANDQETIAAPVQRRRQSNFVLLPRGRKEGRSFLEMILVQFVSESRTVFTSLFIIDTNLTVVAARKVPSNRTILQYYKVILCYNI